MVVCWINRTKKWWPRTSRGWLFVFLRFLFNITLRGAYRWRNFLILEQRIWVWVPVFRLFTCDLSDCLLWVNDQWFTSTYDHEHPTLIYAWANDFMLNRLPYFFMWRMYGKVMFSKNGLENLGWWTVILPRYIWLTCKGLTMINEAWISLFGWLNQPIPPTHHWLFVQNIPQFGS